MELFSFMKRRNVWIVGFVGAVVAVYALLAPSDNVKITQSGTADARYVYDCNWQVVKSIEVTGDYVDVTRCEVVGSQAFGIVVWGKHVDVYDNIVRDGVNQNRNPAGSVLACANNGWNSGIKVARKSPENIIGGEDVRIFNNVVYNNCGEGIAATRGIDVEIFNNVVYDNYSVNIYFDNSDGGVVRDNYTYCFNRAYYRNGNPAAGIALGKEYYDGWGMRLRNVLVEGNTIERCSLLRLYGSGETSGTPSNIVIRDNVFIEPLPYSAYGPVRVVGVTPVNNMVVTATRTAAIGVTITASRTPTRTVTITPSRTATRTPTLIVPTVTPTKICFPVRVGDELVGSFCP